MIKNIDTVANNILINNIYIDEVLHIRIYILSLSIEVVYL
jgi:hypothetical protein